jgi:hypothetical protein
MYLTMECYTAITEKGTETKNKEGEREREGRVM